MTVYASGQSHFGKIAMLTILVIAGVLADWASKLVARSLLSIQEPTAIWPGFNFSLGFNRGVAFGLFPAESSLGFYLMLAVQLLLVGGVLFVFFRATDFLIRMFLAMIVGGASANLFDRLLYGGVTDFLDFYVEKWHWPAFNLADIFICVGVAGLIASDVFTLRKTEITGM